MRAVVQRVTRAAATPGGAIEAGLCILLGVAAATTPPPPPGSPGRSRGFGSSPTATADSTARCSTAAGQRSSSASSRSSRIPEAAGEPGRTSAEPPRRTRQSRCTRGSARHSAISAFTSRLACSAPGWRSSSSTTARSRSSSSRNRLETRDPPGCRRGRHARGRGGDRRRGLRASPARARSLCA